MGGFEWEDFVASARHLADLEHDAYPYPGDRCLFCQQPLDASAHSLIHRIWGFLASEARTQAKVADDLVARSIKMLEALKSWTFLLLNTTSYAHMTRLNPSLAQRTAGLIKLMTKDFSPKYPEPFTMFQPLTGPKGQFRNCCGMQLTSRCFLARLRRSPSR